MTTNQNINAVAGSISKAKTIGGTETTQPKAEVEELTRIFRALRSVVQPRAKDRMAALLAA